MAREVKCQQCETKEYYNEETMTFIVHETASGRKTRKYFHNECLIKYNEKQDFLDKEQEGLDRLVKVVGGIHDVPKNKEGIYQIPRQWFPMIQDLRNGTNRYTRGFKKKYKKGVGWDVLIEAYKLSKDGIQWSKMTKQFKDTMIEMKYGLAIVVNKIPDALKKKERDNHMEKLNKIREQELLDNMKHEREVKYQGKKASYDISELFD